MATDSGYSNQKKKGLAQFETVHNLGSGSYGKVIAQQSLYEITSITSINSVTDIKGSNGLVEFWNIEFPSHAASVGNVLRIESGDLFNYEYEIVRVIDTDNFYILPISDIQPDASYTGSILGWVTNKVGPDGSISVTTTTAPTQYNYNGAPQTVEQDTTTPADNRALPALNFIIKDGVQVPVTKDTGTPGNNIGIPVEIVAASGTPINITAGDINVQLTDLGVNFDAVRLGDGTGNYVGVTASGQARVIAAATDTALASLLAELQLKADLTETQPVSLASVPLPTGAATSALQTTGNTSLGSIDTKLTSQATAANQSTLLTQVGIVTETAPGTDTASSGLNGRLQRIAQRLTSLIALLPSSLGQKTMANSLAVVIASDQSTVATAEAVRTASYQEFLTLGTSAQTITPPANARWVKIYADDTNVANIRVRLAGTATITSGIQFQPGRSEDFNVVGTAISIIAESGTNQKINFHFGV